MEYTVSAETKPNPVNGQGLWLDCHPVRENKEHGFNPKSQKGQGLFTGKKSTAVLPSCAVHSTHKIAAHITGPTLEGGGRKQTNA